MNKNNVLISLSVLFLFISCTNQKKSEDINILGNWQVNSSDRGDIIEYHEIYINKDSLYLFSDAGLTYMTRYKINHDRSITFYNVPSLYSKIEIFENAFIFRYADSSFVRYNKIVEGSLPEIFAKNNSRKDEYYKDYFIRMDKMLEKK